MRIAIQGRDYSASLDATRPLTIERKLNEPSLCEFSLSLPPGGGLPAPSRNQSVAVTGDDGAQYFTGYIASSLDLEYCGIAIQGPRYRLGIRALSDEVLMDQLPLAPSKGSAGMTAGELLATQVAHTRSAPLSASGVSLDTQVGSFAPEPGSSWSKAAAQIANRARAAYRVLGGNLQLSQIPVSVHPLSEADGTLNLASLALTSGARRAVANDITVCGEHEPAAFVTEYFQGDGATARFYLGAEPYFPSAPATTIIEEWFDEAAIDLTAWQVSGSSSYLSLGANGLAMDGGTGIDGQILLSWIDGIEMGGTLLLETTGITLAAGSTGILGGFFAGLGTLAGCVAGFQANAQPGTGAVSLQPVVQGSAAGAGYAVNPANQYTLRIWIHCPECQRSPNTYRSYGDSGSITYGGEVDQAPAKLLFEIQEYANGVAGMPVRLYDGSISALPASCSFVAAISINLLGTMRSINLSNLGSGWVVSTPAKGTPYARRVGSKAQAGECHIDRTGSVVFYGGFAPAAGELVAVNYRTRARAIGRAVDSASQQQLASAGLPSIAAWVGSVTHPPARSSADCRNAASALVGAAASASALWSGSYKCAGPNLDSDVWPGDALFLTASSLNLSVQLIVRSVKLTYASTYPDLVVYDISFANDWADDLAIKTSDTVPADAWLPAPAAPALLPNLTGLAVTAVSGTAITVDTGVVPPAGGGFEIRRRDFAFMPGEDPDLVMRGSQRIMTFSRQAASERFYIRMYDGATPPNYSEFSTAVFLNLPLAEVGDQ